METEIRKLLLPAPSMPPWCAKIPNCTNLTLPDLSRKQLPGSLPLGLYIYSNPSKMYALVWLLHTLT